MVGGLLLVLPGRVSGVVGFVLVIAACPLLVAFGVPIAAGVSTLAVAVGEGRETVEEVAERTIAALKATVPSAVPGVAYLSGGQTDEQATAHLDAMNRIGGFPWKMTFSYGRALQAAPQRAWGGEGANAAKAQAAFAHRAKMNSLASLGQYDASMETGA